MNERGSIFRTIFLLVALLTAFGGLRAQDTVSANCDIYIAVPPCPSNPAEKPGYFILMDQQFQNPSKYWNVSKPYDDNGCVFDFIRNQDNVSFPGNAYLWNTNVPSLGCSYSMGEIKTMTVDTSNHTFRSYYFYGSGYVEAKVRQLYCTPGQGSAMWLWSMLDSDDPSVVHPNIRDNNEIDIFETQPNDSSGFNVTYHWRVNEGLRMVENYYRIHNLSNSWTGWTVFGVSWNSDSITWYVNNKKVAGMQMNSKPSGCTAGDPKYFLPPDAPYCLRFNSGPNSVGIHEPVNPSTLPGHLEIEYVRVYKPVGEKAAPITFFSGTWEQLCNSEISFETSNTVLSANYYPDATYSWSSPAFEIQPFDIPGHLPQHHSGKVKIWLKPGVQANQAYPVILSVSLFSHTEQDTAWLYVTDAPPPLPPDNFQAAKIQGPLCVYEIGHPVTNPSTASCEFFNNETQSWQEAAIRTYGNNRYAFFGRYEPQVYVTFKYREKNACGFSEIRESGLVTPVPPPGSCGW